MKLQTLVADINVKWKGSSAGFAQVTGLSAHSKQAFYGNLFIAKRGCLEAYIEEAVANGVLGVVTEVYNPFLSDEIVQLITDDVAGLERELAKRFYKEPARKLFTIGVTGTNGKTTITYLIKHFFTHLKIRSGLMGTNEYLIDNRSLPSTHTTPDMLTIQKLLREMVRSDCKAVVMEVTSHGLDQNRLDLIDFDVAIFTNLTQDHFDYHKDFENYFNAKAKLFTSLSSDKVAILPDEGIWAEKLMQRTLARVITYGFSEAAMIRAIPIKMTLEKSTFWLLFQGEKHFVELPLVGRFNILNFLAALAALLAKGEPITTLLSFVSSIRPPSGRLERIDNRAGRQIFVDYAHTPDALKNSLLALREYVEGSLIVVFGCGGNRDRGKRPLMGAIAKAHADKVYLTSDNPRTEDPAQIVEEIVKGIEGSNYTIELDRREAIKRAIIESTTKDLILIAGKGHEGYQIFAHKTIDFDDRVQVVNLLNEIYPICCV